MTVKVAIVGSGFGMYGLMPAFSGVDGCKVVSICAKKSARLLKSCEVLGVERTYNDWKQMLQREKPDAVAIAVVPKHQYEIAKYALENGIAVFAEKPLTTSRDTSLDLYSIAKKSSLPNMVDFLFPEIQEWIMAKKTIESGKIGKVISINVIWNLLSYDIKNNIKSWKTDVREGGGALMFFVSHVFYYLEYFMGRIKNIECRMTASSKSANNGDTVVDLIVLFENGCVGNVHVNISYIGQRKHAIEFQGEEGMLVLQNYSDDFVDNFELILSTHDSSKKIESTGTESQSDLEDSRVKVVRSIADRFIEWCAGGVASKPDFEDGLRVQELIEAARQSSEKSGVE